MWYSYADSDVERCDVMYTENIVFMSNKEFVHCGKMLGDSCTSNEECSYKNCFHEVCIEHHYIPSDGRGLTYTFVRLGLLAGGFVILTIIICYYCFCTRCNTKK